MKRCGLFFFNRNGRNVFRNVSQCFTLHYSAPYIALLCGFNLF